jgi:hypothetical protein
MILGGTMHLSQLEDIKDLITIFTLGSEIFAILVKCVHGRTYNNTTKVGNKLADRVDGDTLNYLIKMVAVMVLLLENASLIKPSNCK